MNVLLLTLPRVPHLSLFMFFILNLFAPSHHENWLHSCRGIEDLMYEVQQWGFLGEVVPQLQFTSFFTMFDYTVF